MSLDYNSNVLKTRSSSYSSTKLFAQSACHISSHRCYTSEKASFESLPTAIPLGLAIVDDIKECVYPTHHLPSTIHSFTNSTSTGVMNRKWNETDPSVRSPILQLYKSAPENTRPSSSQLKASTTTPTAPTQANTSSAYRTNYSRLPKPSFPNHAPHHHAHPNPFLRRRPTPRQPDPARRRLRQHSRRKRDPAWRRGLAEAGYHGLDGLRGRQRGLPGRRQLPYEPSRHCSSPLLQLCLDLRKTHPCRHRRPPVDRDRLPPTDDDAVHASADDGHHQPVKIEHTACNLNLVVPTAEDEQEFTQAVPKAAQQSDFVLAMGYFAQKAVHSAAQQNQDKKFAILDFEFTPPVPNIASVLFKDDQEGFLAGLLAGEIASSRNKKVAVIGGVNQPDVRRKVNGFANGVKYACPDCTPYCIYTKSFINEHRESDSIAASIQALNGVDVVYNAASITGTMTLKKLTTENGILAIGDTTDEWITNWAMGSVPGSEKVLTSVIRDYRVMVRELIKAAMNNSFTTGLTLLYGVTNNTETTVLRLADCHEACDVYNADLRRKMEDYMTKLGSGEIKTDIDHKSGMWKTQGGGGTQCKNIDSAPSKAANNSHQKNATKSEGSLTRGGAVVDGATYYAGVLALLVLSKVMVDAGLM
ncbi:basic membrane protein-domain-containing protein [Jimgerdemannia flammicorona]|uniref:Basic membrane protein-domain-containing protein n=1 Tax=Jimgerdemannia flammicorona TaxID=994334 RepID=A0A433DKX8_9FUNG|nr:basic membrane protein-domain-containing protein [Jimgerdemannia flammicorona]